MSLIQIPKIEYITLEQFIPNWTKHSRDLIFKGKKKNHKLNLVDGSRCMVGEAHSFCSDYWVTNNESYCSDCEDFSYSATQLLDCKNYEKFDNFKLDLFTHMLEAHPQLMIK